MEDTWVHGIVMKSVDYGEADRIVTVFSREHGKQTFFARSARRSLKRFGGGLEMFHRYRLHFRDRGRGLPSLQRSEMDANRQEIITDYDRIARASYLTELVLEFVEEHAPHPGLFDLLDQSYEVLNSKNYAEAQSADHEVWLVSCEMKLLTLVGYRPNLDGCVECGVGKVGVEGRAQGAVTFRFYPEHGGLACNHCAGGGGVPLDLEIARCLRESLGVGVEKVESMGLSLPEALQAREVLYGFVRYQLGKELKSARFLDSGAHSR